MSKFSLNYLDELFEEREQFIHCYELKDHIPYKHLGSGCGRSAFLMPDNKVLKVRFGYNDLNDTGYEQNRNEALIYKKCSSSLLAKIDLERSDLKNFNYIIQDFHKPMLYEEKYSIYGNKYLDKWAKCESYFDRKRLYNNCTCMKYKDFFLKLLQLELNHSIIISDLHSGNISETDNEIIIIDYGYLESENICQLVTKKLINQIQKLPKPTNS